MNWNKLLSTERIRRSSKYSEDVRNEYESDFGRIIFSPALRRMHDKTQVFPLTTDDNIHSRLTHSNEVMSIGYTFGLKLCESKKIQQRTKKSESELYRILPIILKNICLIHDIGNAPFGHFGEEIVSEYFTNLKHHQFNALSEHQKRDFYNYDGNAQGLRVLTKLQYLNDAFGLNLTYATLGSYLKYPNYDEIKDKNGKKIENLPIEKSKHGVFESELAVYNKIVEECGLKVEDRVLRHPLCFLMEAADSIAYFIMDMEDGFNKNLYSILDIKTAFEISHTDIAKLVIMTCDNNFLDDNSKIVKIRIDLINYFVKIAFKTFEDNLEAIESGKYSNEILKDDNDKIYDILERICSEKVFSAREINFLETTGYSVFVGLLDYYIKFLFHKNKKFRNRAKSLISKSVINCAIEENLSTIAFKKIKDAEENKTEINLELQTVQEYQDLNQKQIISVLDKEEKKKFSELRKKILDNCEPKFEDLDDYYKFRVIIDFISGMTDQYALNHFQKISGQKI